MSSKPVTQAERIMSLEVQVDRLASDVQRMESKIDDLIALKNKGFGAFWLSSALFGSAVIGLVTFIINIFQGK